MSRPRSETLSVLHVGSIAGVPQVLSRAQRRLGMKSDVLTFQPHQFGYEADIYAPPSLPFPVMYAEKMAYFSKIVKRYDIIHFHWNTVVPFGLDLPLWKRWGKKIVIHHHGDDIRGKREPLLYSWLADAILVSTPDLLEWSPDAVWIPNPIDLERYPYIGVEEHPGPLRIVHAPSDRARKGTAYVIKAVDALKKEGYDVELVLVENMPHHEAVEQYKQADIVVDQLLVGWYGVLAIECMALGKPVCVYIREDLRSYLSNHPLFYTSTSGIKDDLAKLIEDARLRILIGEGGRKFVEKRHDYYKIAKYIFNNIYNSIK